MNESWLNQKFRGQFNQATLGLYKIENTISQTFYLHCGIAARADE
jgi:hypothetical protein